jgi:hypothetical protein
MIHIKENMVDPHTVAIAVDGVLDQGAIPVLKGVCDRHLGGDRKILLDLEGLVHITRDGIGFLHVIHEKISITNLPEFINLDETKVS